MATPEGTNGDGTEGSAWPGRGELLAEAGLGSGKVGGGGVTQAGLRSLTATGDNGERQRFTGNAGRLDRPLNHKTHDG